MKCFAIAASCLALLLGLLLAPAGPAQAFCIYNYSDMGLTVQQTKGCHLSWCFEKGIKPGDKACCNWKNKECNNKGKHDSVLRFDVYHGNWYYCQGVEVKAGGWMDIRGSDKKITCTPHY